MENQEKKSTKTNERWANDCTFELVWKVTLHHRKHAHRLIRTTYPHHSLNKALKIKFMGLIFQLMENGMLFSYEIEYQHGGENYGQINWDSFWILYHEFDWEQIVTYFVNDYHEYQEFLKTQDNYEDEKGNIDYEDYLNQRFY